MSYWVRATLPVALMLSAVFPAAAQDELVLPSTSVQSLYDDCQGDDLEFCSGFMTGVALAMIDMRTFNVILFEDYCPEASTTPAERIGLFIDWAELHNDWNASAYQATYLAFWYGEPCK